MIDRSYERSAAFGPAPACGSGCLPRPGTVPQVGRWLQLGRIVAMLVTLLVGVGIAAVQPLLTRGARAHCMRMWFRTIVSAAGIRLRRAGTSSAAAAAPAGPAGPAAPGTSSSLAP